VSKKLLGIKDDSLIEARQISMHTTVILPFPLLSGSSTVLQWEPKRSPL
jgi:hypothetical protein